MGNSTPRWPIAKPYKQLTTTISSYYAHRTRKEEKEEDTKEKKEKNIASLQEGNEKTSESVEVVNESKN